jgi:hypothetical protein
VNTFYYLDGWQELNLEEDIMFQVSEKASEMLKEFFQDKEEISPIRIFMSQGG